MLLRASSGQKSLMSGYNHIRHGNKSRQCIIIHNVAGKIIEKYIFFFFVYIQASPTDFTP